MNDLKQLLQGDLSWSLYESTLELKSGDEPIVTIDSHSPTGSSFLYNGKNYEIRTEGALRTKLTIESDGAQILSTTSDLFGSGGEVRFSNGDQFGFKFQNAPLVTLSFYGATAKEILRYKLDATPSPRISFSIVDHSIKAEALLFLLILGSFSFKNIARENLGTGPITFSQV